MGKKKIEHVVFDGTRKPKKTIPFAKVNKSGGKKLTIKAVKNDTRG